MKRRTVLLTIMALLGGFAGGVAGSQVFGPAKAEAQGPAEPPMTKAQIAEWLASADVRVKSLAASKVSAGGVDVMPDECVAKPDSCVGPGVPAMSLSSNGLRIAASRIVQGKPAPHRWISLGFADGDKVLRLEMADQLSERTSVVELLPKAVQMLEFRVKGNSRASLGVDHSGRAFLEAKKDKMKGLPEGQ